MPRRSRCRSTASATRSPRPAGTAIVRVAERADVTDAQIAAGRDELREELAGQRRDRFFSAYMQKAKTGLKINIEQDLLAQVVGHPRPPGAAAVAIGRKANRGNRPEGTRRGRSDGRCLGSFLPWVVPCALCLVPCGTGSLTQEDVGHVRQQLAGTEQAGGCEDAPPALPIARTQQRHQRFRGRARLQRADGRLELVAEDLVETARLADRCRAGLLLQRESAPAAWPPPPQSSTPRARRPGRSRAPAVRSTPGPGQSDPPSRESSAAHRRPARRNDRRWPASTRAPWPAPPA